MEANGKKCKIDGTRTHMQQCNRSFLSSPVDKASEYSPFLSYSQPLYHSEAWQTSFQIKMSVTSICIITSF